MIYSVVISSHNQENYLDRAINSLLNQSYNEKFEIIISDTSQKKSTFIRTKYLNHKNIKFIDLVEKYNYPTQDQLFKIKSALDYCNGKYICLLDGDDFFLSDKLEILGKFMKEKEFFFLQDLPNIYDEKIMTISKQLKLKKIKNNFFYKFLINRWPSITCTSAITIRKDILKDFFTRTNPFFWKFLAIDIQLAIFSDIFYKIDNINLYLTNKSENEKNLDKSYNFFFSKNYWKRRVEQHRFFFQLKKEKVFFKGIDFYICKFIYKIINQSKSVKKSQDSS